jgi:hypothetical protein
MMDGISDFTTASIDDVVPEAALIRCLFMSFIKVYVSSFCRCFQWLFLIGEEAIGAGLCCCGLLLGRDSILGLRGSRQTETKLNRW